MEFCVPGQPMFECEWEEGNWYIQHQQLAGGTFNLPSPPFLPVVDITRPPPAYLAPPPPLHWTFPVTSHQSPNNKFEKLNSGQETDSKQKKEWSGKKNAGLTRPSGWKNGRRHKETSQKAVPTKDDVRCQFPDRAEMDSAFPVMSKLEPVGQATPTGPGPSYSDVLAGKAKPVPKTPVKEVKRETSEEKAPDDRSEADADLLGKPGIISMSVIERQRLLRKEKLTTQPLDLGAFITHLSIKSKVKSSPNAVASVSRKTKEAEGKKQGKDAKSARKLGGNVLDADTPVLHKGKTRENPKKKLTTTKKIILQERRGDGEEECEKASDSSGEGADEKAAATVPKTLPENTPSSELDYAVMVLLEELARFQDRNYKKNPEKARLKRRVVCGLREVHKFLTINKVKCVIVAPNIDDIHSPGGLNQQVGGILQLCLTQGVPRISALSKRKLGRALNKPSSVSCVGVLDYQGADEKFREVRRLWEAEVKEEEHSKMVLLSVASPIFSSSELPS